MEKLPEAKRENIRKLERRAKEARGKSPPHVLVLVGIPGCGKSTFADRLVNANWGTRISQDDLGSRPRCERAIVDSLTADRNVVVDRCNFDRAQRKHWVDYGKARGSYVGVVVFAFSLEECLTRVRDRSDHPTLNGGGESDHVVMTMANSLAFPEKSEGFLFCRVVRNNDDFDRVLTEIINAS